MATGGAAMRGVDVAANGGDLMKRMERSMRLESVLAVPLPDGQGEAPLAGGSSVDNVERDECGGTAVSAPVLRRCLGTGGGGDGGRRGARELGSRGCLQSVQHDEQDGELDKCTPNYVSPGGRCVESGLELPHADGKTAAAAPQELEHVASSPASPVGEPGMRRRPGLGSGAGVKPAPAAIPRRQVHLQCIDCLHTPKSDKGRDFLECTSARCNTSATERDEVTQNCGSCSSSYRARNRLCTRCLTEQYGYCAAELQQDCFMCPDCRGPAVADRSNDSAVEPKRMKRCDVASYKRRRSDDDRLAMSSGTQQPQQPMPTPIDPQLPRSRPDNCPDEAGLEQDHPHQGAAKRPKTTRGETAPGEDSASAVADNASSSSHSVVQPPCAKPSDCVLLALRNFLDQAAGDQPGAQCRVTVGVVISALAKSAKSGECVRARKLEAEKISSGNAMYTNPATALSGLEYLRTMREISIDVDAEAVEVASVASVLRISLLNLRVSRPRMLNGDRVMVKGPGNLWTPAQVIAVREANEEQHMAPPPTTTTASTTELASLGGSASAPKVQSQSLAMALLRYDGLGPEWDDWRPGQYSSKLVKLSTAAVDMDADVNALAKSTDSFGRSGAADIDQNSPDVLFTSDEEVEDQDVDCIESSASPTAVRTSVKDGTGRAQGAAEDPTPKELATYASMGIPSTEATAAEESAALAAATAELPYPVGTVVEALDVANKWFAARMVKVDLRKFGNQPRNKRVLIHFIGWGTEWDEWFDLNNPTQAGRLRQLSPTTEFGPFFHTVGQAGMWKADFSSENYRNRIRYVLEAIGNGQMIGFDSLVRAVYEIPRISLERHEAMKLVRRVAKVLEDWGARGIVRWTSPIGMVEVIDIVKNDPALGRTVSPQVSTPVVGGDDKQGTADIHANASDPMCPLSSTDKTAPFQVDDKVEVLDDTMGWFLATIIELPTSTQRGADTDGGSNGSPRSKLQVVSVIESHVGYALCRFDGWSAQWDIWVPASTASGDLPRIRHKTPTAQKKSPRTVAAAGGGTLMAAGVEAAGADIADIDEPYDSIHLVDGESVVGTATKELEFSANQRDATFKEVANIVFSSPEVEARMRRITRQTTKSDEEAIGTTRAEDVPIEVMDTHTIKNLGAFARHDIAAGAFIGEYAGEVTLLSSVRKRKSEYLFNLGSGLTIDASRQGNATRFMNHSSDHYCCNVSAMIVNHRGTRRVVFHAKRLIHHGEEMMYDYGEDFAKNIGKRLI